jgi:type IV pilus biogenesis protein CpaD/CtpE
VKKTAAVSVRSAIAIAALATLGGCAALQGGASSTESDFGQSVRHVVESQKANPGASRNPDLTVVEHSDGPRLESVLETYRGDAGRPSDVKRELILDVSR